MRRTTKLLSIALLLAACDDGPDAPGMSSPNAAAPKEAPAPTEEEIADWTSRMRKVAATFRNLSRVDDLSRWAPTACAMATSPARVPMSAADAKAAAHGGKLYAMWAKDVESYGKLSGMWLVESSAERMKKVEGADGCAQVLVKESFEALELKADEPDVLKPGDSPIVESQWMKPAAKDGKRFKPGAAKGLFVMMHFDKKPASSDDGWVYGTVAPDGAVTGVGRMASCMACHTAAPHGRLFGLARSNDAK